MPAGFAYPGLPGSAPRCLPSTTGSTSWRTTAPRSRTSSRFRLHRPGQRRPRAPSRCWPWWCPCSRPAPCAGSRPLRVRHRPSVAPGVTTRLADAMRRGALCHGQHRLPAHRLVRPGRPSGRGGARALRRVPKSDAALDAGSFGPWEPGGISPFQLRAGRALAEAEERDYESFGASVSPPEGLRGS